MQTLLRETDSMSICCSVEGMWWAIIETQMKSCTFLRLHKNLFCKPYTDHDHIRWLNWLFRFIVRPSECCKIWSPIEVQQQCWIIYTEIGVKQKCWVVYNKFEVNRVKSTIARQTSLMFTGYAESALSCHCSQSYADSTLHWAIFCISRNISTDVGWDCVSLKKSCVVMTCHHIRGCQSVFLISDFYLC